MLIFFYNEVNLDKISITIVKKWVFIPVTFVVDINTRKGGDIIRKKEEIQIDRMINEGLGAGEINDKDDREQLDSPISKKTGTTRINNTMVEGMSDAKELGKEMEVLKTNKEVKKDGHIPDPIQHS
ncbi:hypothetical protein [Bacillus dakarensis]|uniref:hypothetical protein n=1 Tax=Robertmurraya dakarensis TaxID=1926278 RepID=UPI000980E22A|nr:hypothetical protein [Bacillus dakarensis]